MENKIKHLELIQAIINRMSSNSFLLKTWSVTLVSALFALAAKDANLHYVIIAYIPIPVFWLLDGYFISQERAFRSLYESVRLLDESKVNFSMNKSSFKSGKNSWGNSIFSITLLIFYPSLIVTMLVIIYLLS